MAYIEFKNVSKEYGNNEVKLKALKKVNFEIEKGDLIVITGPSKVGKTTLLNILGGIDKVTDGNVIIDDNDITKLKERKLVKYRRKEIGFVFESYNLIENLNVRENILLGAQVSNNKIDVDAIIKKVGLTKKMDSYPSELSIEEQSCTILAMALAKSPSILLYDEPNYVIDVKTKKKILKLLQSLAKKEKVTIIMTTRDDKIAPIANKVITLKNGSISNIKVNKKTKQAGDLSW